MPLTLQLGLSKKVGLPDYGSLGVSCNVQVKLDSTLLLNDAEGFQAKVRQAYLACHRAVQEELDRQQSHPSAGQQTSANGQAANRQPANNNRTNGQVREQTRRATASQVRAIEAIARQQKINLTDLLHQRFNIQKTADLSISEASSLIDELKTAANGSGGGR